MSEHSITIEFNQSFGPTLRFGCAAAPDAVCRTVCSNSACEEGCYHEPGKYPRIPIDYCNNVEWFQNGDDVETWIAGGQTSVTVPVDVSWQDTRYDGPEWRFPTPTVPGTAPGRDEEQQHG